MSAIDIVLVVIALVAVGVAVACAIQLKSLRAELRERGDSSAETLAALENGTASDGVAFTGVAGKSLKTAWIFGDEVPSDVELESLFTEERVFRDLIAEFDARLKQDGAALNLLAWFDSHRESSDRAVPGTRRCGSDT